MYLGHLVTKDGLSTDPEKVEKVKNWPVPCTVRDVRAFLGLAGYYRRFIKKFSVIASPLHKLTQKDVKFKWGAGCQEAFERLKAALISAPILSYPDFSLDFILDTDACMEGSGAVLSQLVDGQEKVVAYFSKKFSKAQRQYSVTRQELLAVISSTKHFRHYLYGRRFRVRTDHGSLRWLTNFRDAEGQMARWIEYLNMFNYSIEHRPGTQHRNADALSRRPHEAEVEEGLNQPTSSLEGLNQPTSSPEGLNRPKTFVNCGGIYVSEKFSSQEVREAQRKDPRLEMLILALEANVRPTWKELARYGVVTKSLWMQWGQLELHQGILYRSFQRYGVAKVLQLVVPLSMKKSVLQMAHDHRTAGHFGRTRTLNKIRQDYFWVNYRQDVTDWVRSCVKCQQRKGSPRKRKAALQPSAVGVPLQRVAMDIMGPLPVSERGNRYVLVVMDYFTKWAEAFPLPNQEAESIAEVFVTQFVCRYGVPSQIHTDRGKNFDSLLMRAICKLLEIDKTLTSSYRPQSDGLVERMNRTIEDILSKYVQYDQRDWDKNLPFALMAYRACTQETTELTPNMLMFGREVPLPLYFVAGRPPGSEGESLHGEYALKVRERLEVAFEIARESSHVAQQRQKRYYDEKVCGQPYRVGEKVWVHNPARTKGISPKFQRKWQGPCVILEKISDANYIIKKPRARNTEVIHFDRLKPCVERSAESDIGKESTDAGKVAPSEVGDVATSAPDQAPRTKPNQSSVAKKADAAPENRGAPRTKPNLPSVTKKSAPACESLGGAPRTKQTGIVKTLPSDAPGRPKRTRRSPDYFGI